MWGCLGCTMTTTSQPVCTFSIDSRVSVYFSSVCLISVKQQLLMSVSACFWNAYAHTHTLYTWIDTLINNHLNLKKMYIWNLNSILKAFRICFGTKVHLTFFQCFCSSLPSFRRTLLKDISDGKIKEGQFLFCKFSYSKFHGNHKAMTTSSI